MPRLLPTRASRIWAAVATLVVLLGAWVAWQAWSVNKDLNDAVDHAEAIQAGVDDGDIDVVERELPGLREASASAADRTSGLTWRALTKLPLVGDDAEGVQLTSDVLDDLARDGVAPLADAATRLDEMLPRDGAIDVNAVESLQGPVAAARSAFAEADQRLAGVDASGFVGRLNTQFTDFRRQVARANRAMTSADVATNLLPGMLGGEGKRNYLLVFQNNAEIRATGGLAGAASYIEADAGKLSIRRHVPGASLGEAATPVLPLSAAEKELYGEVLGTYFVNAGMTPDVPRAADLLRARWEQEFPGDRVDGVLMIDAVAIGYLLDAAGQITVDGVELDADNVVDELLHKAYLRLEDPKAQDAFFAKVAAAAFDRFTGGVDNTVSLVRALSRATDERRVFLRSFDADEQAALDGSTIAGELVTDPDVAAPQIDVTLNDTTGAKMSYFLRYDVDVRATSCVDEVQSFSAKARIRSTAPADAATLPDYVTGGGIYGIDAGHQLVTVRIFAPVGGQLGDLEWNGSPMDLIRVEQDGRAVGMTYVDLAPGQTADLAWTMESGPGQTGEPDVHVTPSIAAGAPVPTKGACR